MVKLTFCGSGEEEGLFVTWSDDKQLVRKIITFYFTSYLTYLLPPPSCNIQTGKRYKKYGSLKLLDDQKPQKLNWTNWGNPSNF